MNAAEVYGLLQRSLFLHHLQAIGHCHSSYANLKAEMWRSMIDRQLSSVVQTALWQKVSILFKC
jgi:hypothetical protein